MEENTEDKQKKIVKEIKIFVDSEGNINMTVTPNISKAELLGILSIMAQQVVISTSIPPQDKTSKNYIG